MDCLKRIMILLCGGEFRCHSSQLTSTQGGNLNREFWGPEVQRLPRRIVPGGGFYKWNNTPSGTWSDIKGPQNSGSLDRKWWIPPSAQEVAKLGQLMIPFSFTKCASAELESSLKLQGSFSFRLDTKHFLHTKLLRIHFKTYKPCPENLSLSSSLDFSKLSRGRTCLLLSHTRISSAPDYMLCDCVLWLQPH